MPGASEPVALGLRAYQRAVVRENRVVRRDRALLVGSLAAIGLLVLARLVGLEAPIPSAGDHPIWRCALMELAGGAVGVGGLVYGARRRFLTASAIRGAAIGAVGAVFAGMWAQMRCPEHDLIHLGVAHVGAVVVAALLGSTVVPQATRLTR